MRNTIADSMTTTIIHLINIFTMSIGPKHWEWREKRTAVTSAKVERCRQESDGNC